MAIVFVDDFRNDTDFSATTILTVPVAGIPAGNLIVVADVGMSDAATLSGVADSKLNSYSVVAAAGGLTPVGTDAALGFAYAKVTNALVNGDTVTVTTNSADGTFAIAAHFSGIASNPLDQANSAADTVGLPRTSPSVLITQDDELLVGALAFDDNSGATTYTASGSFVETPLGDFDPFGAIRLILQYRIVSSIASYASTGDTSVSAQAWNGITTFKAATGGSVAGISNRYLIRHSRMTSW